MRFALTLALLSSTTASHADVVVNTFGPGGNFDSGFFYNLGVAPSNARLGFAFTAAASGALTDLTAALFRTTPAGGVLLELYSDNGGLPGATLGSWTSQTPPASGPNPSSFGPPLHVDLGGTVSVTQGQTYYFVVSRTTPLGQVGWYMPTPTVNGFQVYREGTNPWQVNPSVGLPAYRLETIPAPGSALLLAAGLLAQRRRRA